MQKSSLLFLVEAPHQCLAHTRHAHHPVTAALQLVQDYPWCIVHIVLPAASGKRRKAEVKKETRISLWNWVYLTNWYKTPQWPHLAYCLCDATPWLTRWERPKPTASKPRRKLPRMEFDLKLKCGLGTGYPKPHTCCLLS